MTLQARTTLLVLGLSFGLVLLLVLSSLLAFREFSLVAAREHARASAEIVLVSLTESMVNGVINARHSFLERISRIEGLQSVRILRGPDVTRQFGAGLAEETSPDPVESGVLQSGEAFYQILHENTAPVFRAIIPYVAVGEGRPNCVECHDVSSGTVLGAISMTFSLGNLQSRALYTVGFMLVVVVLAGVLTTFLFRYQLRPVVRTALAVQELAGKAKDGDFSARIPDLGSRHDEMYQIRKDLNRLMMHLERNLGDIGRDVARLMNCDSINHHNLLTGTTEMVEALVDVSQFKQSIEEDLTKGDVYCRIARVLSNKFGITCFSIYEVSSSKNHIKPMVVDANVDGQCRWCDSQILFRADLCRAQRTGHLVDSVALPNICSMFRRPDGDRGEQHICIPVIHSGAVGSVVQLIVSPDSSHTFQLLLPFIQVYLRESASVVEAKRLLESLRESALSDALTGLHNRRYLEEYIETLIATMDRKQGRLSILMMDLDHFKAVNDTYGHDAGDMVLKSLGRVLATQVRASDMVIRFGGEEFIIILQDGEVYSGMEMGEKIRRSVAELQFPLPGGHILHKTISIGVAHFPQDSADFWEGVKFADMALYQAKKTGRNRVVPFTRSLLAELHGTAPSSVLRPASLTEVMDEDNPICNLSADMNS
ncbi:MAG: sensor domain-containing diguanylate cyclase [Magnetococcus sp. WYHC-3]